MQDCSTEGRYTPGGIGLRDLAEKAVDFAVRAHVRHVETDYDQLLSAGQDRLEVREHVRPAVSAALAQWQQS